MSVRDKVLPVIDAARAKIATLGMRRYSVIVRRKTWTTAIGQPGETPTIVDVTLTPTPKVRIDNAFMAQEFGIHGADGTYQDRTFVIDKITPQYTGGGYTPAQLDLKPASKLEEVCIVITGDDGVARECDLISKEFDRAFNYKLKVRLKRRVNNSSP
jgi:hypothetical protein